MVTKNPLRKRLPRELRSEFGKYLVIFVLMVLSIGFISGFLVAGESMILAYNESFEKYQIEDGHLIAKKQLSEEQRAQMEALGIRLYPQFFYERDLEGEKRFGTGSGLESCTLISNYRSENMKTIKVVAAVLYKDGKIFATQRGYGDFKDWWEFPGGKIEPGETPEEALIREIHEELDADIHVDKFLYTVEWDYPKFHLTMHCFMSSLLNDALHLNEHEAARWLVDQGIAKNTNCVRSISAVCLKKPCTTGYGYRKKAYGFGWEFSEINPDK